MVIQYDSEKFAKHYKISHDKKLQCSFYLDLLTINHGNVFAHYRLNNDQATAILLANNTHLMDGLRKIN